MNEPAYIYSENLATALYIAIRTLEDEGRGDIILTAGFREVLKALRAGEQVIIKD